MQWVRPCAVHCNTLQHNSNILQHTATHCNTLQHAATHCREQTLYAVTNQHERQTNTKDKPTRKTNQHEISREHVKITCVTSAVCCLRHKCCVLHVSQVLCVACVTSVPVYNTQQHTATHCHTLQHTTKHCNTKMGHSVRLRHSLPGESRFFFPGNSGGGGYFCWKLSQCIVVCGV